MCGKLARILVAPLFILAFILIGFPIANTDAVSIENGNEIELDSELSYYITVNYDGVDVFGVESSNNQMANVNSGRIKVVDKLPQGLTFKSFVTTEDGTIGAYSRSNSATRCGGKVYDDAPDSPTDTGIWNADGTIYSYHGLHYNKTNHTVSFYAERLRAGCQLSIGLIAQTPSTVDDPDTDAVEIRRDFYNTAEAFEGNLSPKSNTVHSYIGRDITTMYKVSYEYIGDVPANAPTPPAQTEQSVDANVSVENSPALDGYTFSGWTSEDVAVENGVFTMPASDVTFKGSFSANPQAAKYEVRYIIDGDAPADYVAPKTKSYFAGDDIALDETQSDTIADYTFSGWTSNDVTLSEAGFVMPEQDVEIHGSFTQNKYNLSYSFEGEIMPPNADSLLPETKQYARGEQVSLADSPTVNGYKFTGWYSEPSFEMPDHDLVITGEWKREDGVFAPEITIEVLNSKDYFDNGETIRFKTTVTNTADFDIADVYVHELMEGAKFDQSAPVAFGSEPILIALNNTSTGGSADYILETDTLARIPSLAKGKSAFLYSSYTPNVEDNTDFTNTVRLLGADPADEAHSFYSFDTDQEHTASVNFSVIISAPESDSKSETEPLPIPINPQTLDTISKVALIGVICGAAFVITVRFVKSGRSRTILSALGKHSKTSAIVLLASAGLVAGGFFLANVFADDSAKPSINIGSSHASFENGDAGSWKITESAKWTSKTTAEISLAIDSKPKLSVNDKDIILVLDNSTSMEGDRLASIKSTTKELIQNTLENQNNQIALISFASSAEIISPLTNDADALIDGIDSMVAYGSTNYYKALSKVEELLQSRQTEDDRETVVLFLTDGAPVQQTPQEAAKYITLKDSYSNLTINAVQYEMGDTVMPQLEAISDNQFIIQDSTEIDKALFQAASVPYYYRSFDVTNYIDSRYWELDSTSTNLGTTDIDGDAVNWDLGRHFRPGRTYDKPTLKIKLNLKEQYHEADASWPVSTKTIADSTILDGEDENISTTDTPILQHKYNVIYEANLPSDCTSDITLPETERRFVFDAVELQDMEDSCDGYNFAGWQIANTGVTRINSDYARMPSEDLIIRATWTKLSLDKSMEGTLHEKSTAMLNVGQEVNNRMKTLSGGRSGYNNDNDRIISIRRAAKLSSDVDITNRKYILSANNSELPIYAWYDNGTIYYYTEADTIYLNPNSNSLLRQMIKLEDISALEEWDASQATNLSEAFFQAKSITNIDALANWDMSNVTTAYAMFKEATSIENLNGAANWDMSKLKSASSMFMWMTALTDISGLANWDTSSVTNMNDTFFHNIALSDISPLANWDVSHVTDMGSMFRDSSQITDISALSSWKTDSLTRISYTFSATGITNVDALADWDVSHVTTMESTFSGTKITNLDGIADWNVSNVTNMIQTFQGTPITSVDALADWDVSHVTSMSQTFNGTGKLTDTSGFTDWNVSSVENMNWMFSGSGIPNINDLSEWNVSNVTNMNGMFSSTKLTNIDGALDWDVSSVKNMGSMFASARQLENIDGAINWHTTSLTNMNGMFEYAYALTQINGAANWDTSKVKEMRGTFNSCQNLSNIDGLANWDVSSLTDTYIMFQSDRKITSLNAMANWDVRSLKSINAMFNCALGLTNIDGLSAWQTVSLEDMSGAFEQTSIRNVNGAANWDTSKVRSMGSLFYRTPITDLSGMSGWDTSNVTNMSAMFVQSRGITNIDGLESWDTSKVTNMSRMFESTNVTNINAAAEWDTSKVTNMESMFKDSNITDLSGMTEWDTGAVINMKSMFSGDSRLTDLSPIEEWDVTKVTNMSEMFYGDRNISDLSPLNSWETTNLENKSNMFYNVPAELERPDWY